MRKELGEQRQIRMLNNSRNALLRQEEVMKKWGKAKSSIHTDRRIDRYWTRMGKPEMQSS